MRDRIGFKLERTGPMFGVAVLVEEAALREYALALLQYFSTPPSGTKCCGCVRGRCDFAPLTSDMHRIPYAIKP